MTRQTLASLRALQTTALRRDHRIGEDSQWTAFRWQQQAISSVLIIPRLFQSIISSWTLCMCDWILVFRLSRNVAILLPTEFNPGSRWIGSFSVPEKLDGGRSWKNLTWAMRFYRQLLLWQREKPNDKMIENRNSVLQCENERISPLLIKINFHPLKHSKS